jgi:hypothetical protein
MSVSYGGDSITFADGSIVSSGSQGFKNKIINGHMMIDQRNAGAAISAAGNVYTVDRFLIQGSQTGKFNVQQRNSANSAVSNYESGSAPTGYVNSLKITVGTAVTVGSGDYFILRQPIEGNNVADLDFGLSTAKTVTLSFWVKSSLIGLHSGHLTNASSARWYAYTYTINVADTWEYKTIVIPGDQSGTWLKDNGMGIYVGWSLGTGSTNAAAGSNAWSSSTGIGAPSEVNTVATVGATFYITGVQLEKGTTASSFEFRSYGKELMLCQRYFQTTQFFTGIMNSSSSVIGMINWSVWMRSSPTISTSGNIEVTDGYTADYSQSSGGISTNYQVNNSTGAMVSMVGFSGMAGSYRFCFARQSTTGKFTMTSEL